MAVDTITPETPAPADMPAPAEAARTPWYRRPFTWVIAAVAFAIAALTVGLLLGGLITAAPGRMSSSRRTATR
jgi:hypothetical protein